MHSRQLRRSLDTMVLALSLAACMSTSATLAAESPAAQPVTGKITWVYDYNEAKRVSKQTGKPMFVVFRCER